MKCHSRFQFTPHASVKRTYFILAFRSISMLDIATQISPFLDVLIVILAVILVYLLATKIFLNKWQPPQDDETETLEMIQEDRQRQIADLTQENLFLQETVKQAKAKYMKRKIDASTYKKIVEDSQERMVQNDARLRFLK